MPAPAGEGAPAHVATVPEPRRRGAVPLVPGAGVSDSSRDTHTSMRVPGPEELAGGAHGTARAPRMPGQRRAGSARYRSQAERVRRRRIRLGAAAVALAAAAGVGGWLLTGGGTDGGDAKPGGSHSPGVHRTEPGRVPSAPPGASVAPLR